MLQIEVFPELTHWLRTRSHLVRVFRVNRWSHDQWTKSIKSLKPLLIANLRMARKHYKWMNKSLFFQWTCTRSLICILDVLQIKVKAQTIALGSRLFINMAGVDNWRTCLNELKIFKQLRENNCTDSIQKRKLHSKSLVQVLDSDVYVWDGYAAQLLNYNLKNFSDSPDKKSRSQVVYIYIQW